MVKEFQTIQQQIKNKQLAPVYFLDGEEPYYIDLLLEHFENDILTEDERSFNLVEIFAKDIEGTDVVIANAKRYPMFSDYIIVIVRDAAALKNLELIESYLEQPSAQTILVFDHRSKTLDKRSKLYKTLQKSAGVHATFNKVKEYEMPAWIAAYGVSKGIQIPPSECEMLSVYLGNDLQKVVNELEKVMINEPTLKALTVQHIEKYIGISKEYNVIDLPQVIFNGDKNRLARMVAYFSANPKNAPMVMIIGILYSFLNKLYLCFHSQGGFEADKKLGIWSHHRQVAQTLHLHQIYRCISILEEFNCKSRGIESHANDTALLKEMIGKFNQVIFKKD